MKGVIMKSYCKHCHSWKDVSHFNEREDRTGYYAWCIECMDAEGRSTNYPAMEERGGGKAQ